MCQDHRVFIYIGAEVEKKCYKRVENKGFIKLSKKADNRNSYYVVKEQKIYRVN